MLKNHVLFTAGKYTSYGILSSLGSCTQHRLGRIENPGGHIVRRRRRRTRE